MPKFPSTLLRLLVFALAILTRSTHAGAVPDVILAAKTGDHSQLRSLLKVTGAAGTRDDRGNTALHWAALRGDVTAVAALLQAGAQVNATNKAGATALHYGVGSERIVGLLLKAGANPNARSVVGSTPLHSAAARYPSYTQVKLLLNAGAVADAVRSRERGTDDLGQTPLSLAAFVGDERTVKLLLDHGAAPGGIRGTNASFSPVASASFAGQEGILKLLVAHGASVNCDDEFAGHALNDAFYTGHRHLVPFLLDHGADLHQKSSFGERVPPMVWAAYDETGDATFAQALLQRGVDINESSSAGSTALSWALKRGETPLVAFLRSHSAQEDLVRLKRKAIPDNPVPQDAPGRQRMLRQGVQKAVTLLQQSSDAFLDNGFVKESGCVSCHQETLPAVAYALARERGFQVSEQSLARQLTVQQTGWSKRSQRAYEMYAPQPAPPAVIGYGLYGLQALGYQSDDLTEANAWYLAETQLPDGSWPDYDVRPPMEGGVIVGTALTVRALKYYRPAVEGQPLKARLIKARHWLEHCRPTDLNQRTFRYHGLGWAGATPAELTRETRALLALQRPDGGWAALPGLDSDAWMTGHLLVALHEAGGLDPTDAAYERGVEFLLRTQFDDGSWWVKSRTWPFQPHFDSQFPHGKDQWISAGGTAWASIALLLTLEPSPGKDGFPSAQQLVASVAITGSAPATRADQVTAGTVASSIDFDREIRPIFERSCVGCHSGEKPRGQYDLTGRESALKGGQSGEPAILLDHPEQSPMLRFVQNQVEDLEMPPLGRRSKYPPLTQEEVAKLSVWVAQGASWPQGLTLHGPNK